MFLTVQIKELAFKFKAKNPEAMWCSLGHKGGETQLGISQRTSAKIIGWNQELGSQELREFAYSFNSFLCSSSSCCSFVSSFSFF